MIYELFTVRIVAASFDQSHDGRPDPTGLPLEEVSVQLPSVSFLRLSNLLVEMRGQHLNNTSNLYIVQYTYIVDHYRIENMLADRDSTVINIVFLFS